MLPNLPPGMPTPPGWMPGLPPLPPGMKMPPMPGTMPPLPTGGNNSRPSNGGAVDLWGDVPSAPSANNNSRPPMPPLPPGQSYPYPAPNAGAQAAPSFAPPMPPGMPPLPPGLAFPPGMPPLPPMGGGGGYGGNNNNNGGNSSYPPRDNNNGYNNNNTDGYSNNNNNYSNERRPYEQRRQDNNNREVTNTVWLGGQVDRYADSHYIKVFAPFGKIMRLSRLNPQKQTVFIHYRHREEAQNAVREIQSRGVLGPDIRLGYGKQFDYTPEEMSLPYNPNDSSQHTPAAAGNNTANGAMKRGREEFSANGVPLHAFNDPYGDGGAARVGGARVENSNANTSSNYGGYGGAPPPGSARSNEPQPSNVLWVGEIPPSVSTEELRAHFGQFKFRDLSRNDNKGIAFIHFDTLEECQHVLDLMRNVTLRGHMLRLNYGTARKPREEYHAQYGGPPPVTANKKMDEVDPSKEIPSNRLFVGGLPYEVSRGEVDAIFNCYTGFLETRVMAEKHFAFVDFDTAENCASCRYALLPSPVVLKGQTLRISFAKEGHNNAPRDANATMAPVGGSGLINFGTDVYGDRRQQNQPPMAMAVAVAPAAPKLLPPSAAAVPAGLRPPPPARGLTVDERAQTLKGSLYNALAEGNNPGKPETNKSLSPEAVQAICDAVDATTSSEAKDLETALAPYMPQFATHAFAIIGKRLYENFNADCNRKVLVMTSVMRTVLKPGTAALDFSTDTVEAVLTVLGISAMNQDNKDNIKSIRLFLDHFKKQFFAAGGVHTGKYQHAFIERATELAKDVSQTLDVQEEFVSLMM